MHITILSPWSNTWHSVEPATYVDNFLPQCPGFFSMYCSTASLEKAGSSTMQFSSLTKSMRLANSGSLLSFLLIPNTFLDYLPLVPPGSFDTACTKLLESFNRKIQESSVSFSTPMLDLWLMFNFLSISSSYSMSITIEQVKLILCCFITILLAGGWMQFLIRSFSLHLLCIWSMGSASHKDPQFSFWQFLPVVLPFSPCPLYTSNQSSSTALSSSSSNHCTSCMPSNILNILFWTEQVLLKFFVERSRSSIALLFLCKWHILYLIHQSSLFTYLMM